MCAHITFIKIMCIFFLLMFIFVFITDYIEIKFQKHKVKSDKEKYKI
jgi:hypothetical protein